MSEADIIKNTVGGPITSESVQKDLAAIGVKPGMVLLVHTSLSKIGWVSGGPVAVILALEEVLGPEGTLVMPTHSGDLSDPEEWSNPPVPQEWKEIIRQTMPAFDPEMTPTRAMGRITDNHSLDFSLGDGSPLARIYDLEGRILLLGVEHDNNTSLHLAEYWADFEGKKEIKQGAPIIVDGKRQWIRVRDWEEHSENFIELGKAYKNAGGSLVEGKIGMADSLLIPQRELVDFGVNWIETNVKIQKKGSN